MTSSVQIDTGIIEFQIQILAIFKTLIVATKVTNLDASLTTQQKMSKRPTKPTIHVRWLFCNHTCTCRSIFPRKRGMKNTI